MQLEPKTLNILCWAGYDDPCFVKDFETRFGCTVVGKSFESDMQASNRICNEHRWDLVNINNPYVSEILFPKGKILPLDTNRFSEHDDRLFPQYRDFFSCSLSQDGQSTLGICQRFGPFNLVVNTNSIDAATARAEGFSLADDPANMNRFGLLDYPEFNVMHASIACGINPFDDMTESDEIRVSKKLHFWRESALIYTNDHHRLNQALVGGSIRFYISGGVYTAAVARRAGHGNIMSITPHCGPIIGRGGIAFVEVTSVCAKSKNKAMALNFLEYVLEPEQCHRIAFANGIHNPVAQMHDPQVMEKFTREELHTIQFDTLESDMSRCGEISCQLPHIVDQ